MPNHQRLAQAGETQVIYDITITREYRVEAQSSDDAVIEALRLEETAAHEWPSVVDVQKRVSYELGKDCDA